MIVRRPFGLHRLALLVSILLTVQHSYASSTAHSPIPEWPLVGRAELQVLWWKIYSAELASPSGQLTQPGDAALLTLTYHRDIAASQLISETRKQLAPFASSPQIETWLAQLQRLWPDIKEGDRLSFLIDDKGTGHFYFNGAPNGAIADPTFSTAFISIWLSDASTYPHLAKQLRGANTNLTQGNSK